MDDSFKKAPIAVPKLSGFDKSHQNLFTGKVGTIIPALVDELIPGSKVNLKMALSASLPPLASDTFMRCSIKAEAFFCPSRLLSGAYEAWFTDEKKELLKTNGGTGALEPSPTIPYLPVIGQMASGATDVFESELRANGSLADYLGFRTSGTNVLNVPITALPFLAYHRIYHDWYRNSLVQKECFLPTGGYAFDGAKPSYVAATSPYIFHHSSNYVWNSDEKLTLADGVRITQLRQRNFGLDYFTTATPNPQQGSAQVVSFNTSGSTGQFSIAALRAANSMQQFKERNNLLGNLYVEQIAGRYGVRPSDAIAQRSLYIGRGEFEVYSKGIYQSVPNAESGDSANSYPAIGSGNPFGSVATRYGSAFAQGDHFLVNFEAKEHGYLFVMVTLVPRVTYSSGVDKYLRHYCGLGSLSDMANPILQNVGPQPIVEDELTGNGDTGTVFGYTDRYAEFKTRQDQLHGLVRDGQSLESFALQRSFAANAVPRINSSFLEIPTDYMDQITAVKEWLSDYGYWCDTYFQYRVAMPLSKYSLPSLQDPAYEHGKTIIVSKGGSKL